MGTEIVRVHVFAGGLVQGVAYRFFTEKYAARLGITGWVRNLPDGRVEVLAEGSADQIGTFLKRLKDGPSAARIESFEVLHEPATGEFQGFRIAFYSG